MNLELISKSPASNLRPTLPMLVLGAADDTIFHPDQIHATARAYATAAIIFPNMAHDMMLEPGWEAVAARIVAWLMEKGL